MNRFRELVAQLPGLRKKQPSIRLFMEKTLDVEAMRNIVQHLRQELQKMASAGVPVLGTLCWLYVISNNPLRVRSCLLAAGRLQTNSNRILNPASKAISANLDHITLRCSSRELSLTECYRA